MIGRSALDRRISDAHLKTKKPKKLRVIFKSGLFIFLWEFRVFCGDFAVILVGAILKLLNNSSTFMGNFMRNFMAHCGEKFLYEKPPKIEKIMNI